jgi:hypothetical protein
MDNISPSRSLPPGAVRMRRYRKQRRQGLKSVRILLDETDRDALIRMGLLTEDQLRISRRSRPRSPAFSTGPRSTSRDV